MNKKYLILKNYKEYKKNSVRIIDESLVERLLEKNIIKELIFEKEIFTRRKKVDNV